MDRDQFQERQHRA